MKKFLSCPISDLSYLSKLALYNTTYSGILILTSEPSQIKYNFLLIIWKSVYGGAHLKEIFENMFCMGTIKYFKYKCYQEPILHLSQSLFLNYLHFVFLKIVQILTSDSFLIYQSPHSPLFNSYIKFKVTKN